MNKNNKVIFIGPEAIHNAFSKMDEYDFQEPIVSLKAFQEEMRLDESKSKISRNSSVIIFFSRLYKGSEKEFARLVAYYAPYAVVAILIPNADKDMAPRMESLIKTAKREFESESGGRYNPSTPTYFISYEAAIAELRVAMSDFVSDPNVSKEVKARVIEMLPDAYKNVIAHEEEIETAIEKIEEVYGDDDTVVLPPDDGRKGKVIAVTSSKGGSGKSTVSMVLAAYIAKASRLSEEQGLERKRLKVCVVDFDTRDGQLGFLNARTSPTVFNIIGKAVGNQFTPEAIKEGIYSSPGIEADFIFAPRRTRHAKEIKPMFYVSIINELKNMYDYIILDTSVNYLDVLLEEVAYPMANKIIFVTDMGVSSVMGMARWITETTSSKETGGSGIDKNKIGVTVNKVLDDVNMDAARLQKATRGIPVIAMLPSAPKLITYKANTTALQDILLKKQINQSFRVLAKSVIDKDYQLAEVPYAED